MAFTRTALRRMVSVRLVKIGLQSRPCGGRRGSIGPFRIPSVLAGALLDKTENTWQGGREPPRWVRNPLSNRPRKSTGDADRHSGAWLGVPHGGPPSVPKQRRRGDVPLVVSEANRKGLNPCVQLKAEGGAAGRREEFSQQGFQRMAVCNSRYFPDGHRARPGGWRSVAGLCLFRSWLAGLQAARRCPDAASIRKSGRTFAP